MPTSHFDRGLLPSAREFYEREIGKLSRPSRGWARTVCLFHQGSNPTAFAVNLSTGGFYCFNCGVKGGDILDFVQLHDKVDFKRAAQLLGVWRDQEMSPTEKYEIRCHLRAKERRRAAEAEQKQAEHDRRIAARDWLHLIESIYKFAAGEFTGSEDDWELLSLLHPAVRDAEEAYWQAAGIELRSDACCKVIEVSA